MSPLAHLVGSWLIAAATTNNSRDRKLVTWAGVLPDADGFGVIPDLVQSWISGKECTFHYYQTYHHLLSHGWPGAISISLLLTLLARRKWRVLFLCLITFHLHLICDLIGSRGPTIGDLLPIFYSEPLFRHPIWFFKNQWKLDGWQNRTLNANALALRFFRPKISTVHAATRELIQNTNDSITGFHNAGAIAQQGH